jgi:hypothetical protein
MQICVGPAACAGDQACTADGSGWGPCACRTTVWGNGDQATALPTSDGWEVTVVAGGGTYHVTWLGAADGTPMLTFQAPDGKLYGPHAMDRIPSNANGANLAAYYLVVEAIAVSAPKPQDFTSNNPKCQNHAGCDVLQNFVAVDCSAYGGCCDAHDACINANCTAKGDSCSIFGMFLNSLSPACASCHVQVIGCFADCHAFLDGSGGAAVSCPGPGDCCNTPSYPLGSAMDACGEPQQCMDNGVVVVDPAICADAGINPPAHQDGGGAGGQGGGGGQGDGGPGGNGAGGAPTCPSGTTSVSDMGGSSASMCCPLGYPIACSDHCCPPLPNCSDLICALPVAPPMGWQCSLPLCP